ncbi:MAG TPA: SHOCT domain-containing protein [Polyangia bacterium]|nr:SHOCT domain-containing protein [Polyangia bacterium]
MYYGAFWGMNFFWWIFWAMMIFLFFAILTPVPRRRARLYADPLSILRTRYARGEITTEEYNERRTVLLRTADERAERRDAGAPTTPGAPAPGPA